MQIAELLNAALADRYVLEGEIGRGGMAIVYRARDVRHRRTVALKVLNPELAAVLGATRFLEEIRVTANLQHPNLLPLFDSGAADGLLFYVMPFIEGESLRGRLTREKQLPIDEAVHIAASVAGALEYAHKHGVIHRDLKPENILLQEGQPMVADFGIALAVTRAGGERVTQTGISLGTPQYMSPEQATGDRVVDGRSDIYSLAAMLHEMLTGDPPHIASSVQAIIAKVLTETAPSVRVTRPHVPEHVAYAISRGLEKVPADRWPSAQAFADVITGGRRVTAADVPSLGTWRLPAMVSRRRTMLLAALGAVAVVGVGGAAIKASRTKPRPQLSSFELALPDAAAPRNELGPSLALSRDGSLITYIGSSSQALFVRPIGERSSRRIAGTEGALCPSFSPDGRWIVFTSQGRLRKVALGGGAPIVITDSTATCGVWTDRDEILFALRGELFRVSANGGPVSVVARVDTSKRIGVMFPSQALPGGDAALINVSETFNVDWQPAVVSLPSGEITRLPVRGGAPRFTPRHANGFLLYRQQGTTFATPFSLRTRRFTGPEVRLLQDSITDFTTSENGTLVYVHGATPGETFSLVAVAAGGRVRTLAGSTEGSPLDTAHYAWPRLSPDGKRIALEMLTGNFTWDIWIYDLVSRALSRLTQRFSGIRPAGWTADGKSVVYIALDSGSLAARYRLVVQAWDGSAPARELMPLPSNVHDLTVDPGLRHVALAVSQTGHTDIWFATLGARPVARPFIDTRSNEGQPRLSPDGKLLAYFSRETGRPEVYVRPVLGAPKRLHVSAGPGWQPVWSADGRQLYYRVPGYMMRASLANGSELGVTRRDTLFRDDFVQHNVQNYDVFPGGKELLMIRSVAGTMGTLRAAVVLNWPELLRQRIAVQ